jgi:hypothetical protein
VTRRASARGLGAETALSTLGPMLEVVSADEDELYEAMDWLLPKQPRIEAELAGRHLKDGALVLYDVTSTYFEGRTCPLARFGHSRDGKKDKLQIVFGLMCNADGCPVAVEVFEGNMADPKTLPAQIRKCRERFGLKRIVLVGDRGLLTEARIAEDLRGVDGLDWITALRAPAIRALAEQKVIQPSLFDERDLAEIHSPDYPGERLVACRNPFLADERRRQRDELIRATAVKLDAIVAATRRAPRPLRGAARLGLRVGRVWQRYKVAKYFDLHITETAFSYTRNAEAIAADAAIAGIYVIRTSVEEKHLSPAGAVRAYKGLSVAERAFRSLKTVDLKVRPIHQRLADRVRAHVFLCMLAYHVEWHLRRALAPLLFEDDDLAGAAAQRRSVVASARRSPRAEAKAATKRTAEGYPVHRFQTLLADLATLTRNTVRFLAADDPRSASPPTPMLAQPTLLQQRVFDLLEVPLLG